MSIFANNPDFYPTPPHLIQKMIDKVKWNNVKYVLEPSAGDGNIVEALNEKFKYGGRLDISCIEKDINLFHILRGKNFKVIDTDFLDYTGQDALDLIIANPPFSEGDKHLLKAIEVMFSGQIVFLLNAETLKNPYTNSRKLLVQKLSDLSAEIEYISDAFVDAERKTNVEVALIYISIEQNVEDLFKGAKFDVNDSIDDIDNKTNQVSHRHNIKHIVAEYNWKKQQGIDFIISYFSSPVREYFPLDKSNDINLDGSFKDMVASFIRKLRKDYWKKTLNIPEFYEKLTSRKIKEFHECLDQYSMMEFTEYNVLNFLENLTNSYMANISDAILKVFDDMTKKYSWWDETSDNILHFNGWKTNDAFKVNHKVILPYYEFFDKIWNCWSIGYGDKLTRLGDIDKVMNFFSGKKEYKTIVSALEEALAVNKTRNIESEFFIISVYKKGTIHLTFKDKDVLRRFNVFVCKEKGWLPNYYSAKAYDEMDAEGKKVVDSFEGKGHYINYGSENLLNNGNELLKIGG